MDIEAGSFDLFTLDAGVQWQTEIGLSLGAAGYSLTNSDRRESPVGWGAGLGYQIGIFSAEADVRYNAQIGKARWSGGLGVVIANMVPLRAGVAYDLATDSLLVSGGIGYQDSSFGADIAYRQRVVHGTLASDAPGDRILAIAIRVNVF
jgi:hypothetical protein